MNKKNNSKKNEANFSFCYFVIALATLFGHALCQWMVVWFSNPMCFIAVVHSEKTICPFQGSTCDRCQLTGAEKKHLTRKWSYSRCCMQFDCVVVIHVIIDIIRMRHTTLNLWHYTVFLLRNAFMVFCVSYWDTVWVFFFSFSFRFCHSFP